LIYLILHVDPVAEVEVSPWRVEEVEASARVGRTTVEYLHGKIHDIFDRIMLVWCGGREGVERVVVLWLWTRLWEVSLRFTGEAVVLAVVVAVRAGGWWFWVLIPYGVRTKGHAREGRDNLTAKDCHR